MFSVGSPVPARFRGILLALLCAVVLALSAGHAAGSNVDDLIDRLKNGEDFRVRVQAALELGKTKSPAGRVPLEGALDDENAAVRTAAAAALKVLGDKRSIPPLEAHKDDSSAAVRTQIEATLVALRASSSATTFKMVVKMGKMRSSKEASSGKLLGEMEQASRQRFGEIPGVKVVDANASDEESKVKGKKVPTVMITGQIRKLNESNEGSEVVYSASVEYIVHRMPEQAIAGTVSGSASTKTSRAEAKKRALELKRLVLAAAVESAVKRAPEALAAATK